MPIFLVNTNVAKAAVPVALLSEATEELAKRNDIIIQHCSVILTIIKLNYSCNSMVILFYQLMTFWEKTAPCAYCSLHSIGLIHLCFRLYINLFEMVIQNLAWDNTMFKVFIEAYHAKK
uniref:Uncharacterized protein n=1 Tax=Hucho hucho TaxID=62062 RepID=A0A4W5KS85_9TELE